MAALDNEKRILSKLNQTYSLDLEKSTSGKIKDDLQVSVDFIWELNGIRILFEVDSYNAAKIVFGQYVLLNHTKEYQNNCILIVIHCYKKYNIERTEKYLKFAQEKLKCKIPFLVFNELDWIQFIKSKSKQQFINYLKKYLK
jgi:hypothetical protein